MADAAARITKCFSLFRDKFPRVLLRRKCELQHPEGLPVADFAVRSGKANEVMTPAAGPGDDFADPVHGVRIALRVLWRKALIGMFVSGNNQGGVGGVQVFPELLQLWMYRVFLEDSAAEQRMMAVG